MPFLNGVYKRIQSWKARAAAGAPISAVEFDADGDDEAAALSLALLRDGTSLPTADLPMNGHALTGLRPGAASGESVTFDQMNAAITLGQGLNKLDNATFQNNQRATASGVVLGTGAYGHDRWKAGANGCQYQYAVSGPDVAITIVSGSLLQIIPASDIEGGAYTLSQDAAGTAQGRVYQGSASGAPALAALPVLNTALSSGVAAVVEFGPGTILRPQLALGATARSFARRNAVVDTLSCQRFYEVGSFGAAQYSSGSGSVLGAYAAFKVTKAAVPTVTVLTSNGTVSNPVAIGPTVNGALIDGLASNSGSGTAVFSGTFSAACDL